MPSACAYFVLLLLFLGRRRATAVIVRDLQRQGPDPVLGAHIADLHGLDPLALLFESARVYPWNWSCWLEIAETYHAATSSRHAPPPLPAWFAAAAQQLSSPASSSSAAAPPPESLVHRAFLVLLLTEGSNLRGETALQLLAPLLAACPLSQGPLGQLAMTHYLLRDYEAAAACFER